MDRIPAETDYGIITRYDPPPIPLRQFDFTTYRPGYEPDDSGYPLGYGRTPEDAIADLLDQEWSEGNIADNFWEGFAL